MEPSFITIAEAMEKTGRSASTVRRLIHTITETKDHPDRDAVEPDAKQVAVLKKKNENFTWKIREDVVTKHFQKAPAKEKKTSTGLPSDVLDVLRRELEMKNQQIEKQWEVIHSLNDRLREGNILMGSLQKRLAPPSQEPAAEEVVEASAVAASGKSSADTQEKAPRKGIFAWMRR